MEVTAQTEYICSSGMWTIPSGASVDNGTTATLTTELRTDCINCVSPATAPAAVVVTEVEHCVGTY